MKRTAFKRKEPLTDAQKQLRDALKQAKVDFKAKFRSNTTGVVRGGKCYEDGIRFDSHWEREVYRHLKLRKAAGEIYNLDTHVTVVYEIKREDGTALKQSINIDFQYNDNLLNRPVRLDAKQPKFRINKRTGTKTNLDNKRKDWFLKWEILKFLQPDYHYEIARPADGWRTYEECGGSKI